MSLRPAPKADKETIKTLHELREILRSVRHDRDTRPVETSPEYIVQTSGAIGIFNVHTGRGLFTTQGEYFYQLAQAAPTVFPRDFINACIAALADQVRL